MSDSVATALTSGVQIRHSKANLDGVAATAAGFPTTMLNNIAQIGLAVLLFSSFSNAARAAQEIIVDNLNAQFSGNWQGSKGSNQKYKDDYRFSSSTDTPEPSSTAEFRPKISTAGRYDIDIWYPQGENRSLLAPVTVNCKSGTAIFKVDEKKNGGKWVPVAKGQEFEVGTSGFILIGNNTGTTGSVVVADAIRLVYAGGDGFTATLSPSSGGSLTKNPDNESYPAGSDVQITAVPDEGNVFTGWTGDATGMANPLTVTMSKDKTIGATFVQGGVGAIVEASEAHYEGVWEKGNKQWGKPFSDPYFWNSGGKNTAKKASAVFTPDLPRAGYYDIYVWYVPGGN
ncbi:MAG: exported protein of unknown function, partial [Verrucomicrobiales bacterium]|nr:exported protein of unknown function [Verrucomicrobiales bacterium]